MKKWILGSGLVLGAVVTVILVVFLWFPPAAEEPVAAPQTKTAPAPMVRVMPVPLKDFAARLELTGGVEPVRIAQLAATAEGVVNRLFVREGDRVSANTLLVAIARKDGVAALIESLSRELAQEEDNLQRLEALVVAGALPAEQLDQAGIGREKINVQLINARAAARDFDLRAPWPGVVSRLYVKEGELVAPRSPLVEIYDPTSLIIKTAVPERHAVAMSIGMPVEVKLDAYPGQVFSGQIVQLFPLLDARLRSRTIQIALDQPVTLLPGMFARLNIILESVAAVPGVPAQAVMASAQGPVVYIVEEGKALRRNVETGIEDDGFIQIKKGVAVGEAIVVAGAENLKDGAAVTARPTGSAQPQTGGTQ